MAKRKLSNPVIREDEFVDFDLNPHNLPWTPKQKQFLKLYNSPETKVVLVKGSSGTAKTILAVYSALMDLRSKKASKFIFVRTAVESSDTKLLALPGDVNQKMMPFFSPLYEKLDELLTGAEIKNLQSGGFIEAIPFSYLRGRNFGSNKVIVADEGQNISRAEIINLLTRVGELSKLLILFDPHQSDLNPGKSGAINEIYETFSDEESQQNGIFTFEFGPEDIMRSELVKFIVKKLGIYGST